MKERNSRLRMQKASFLITVTLFSVCSVGFCRVFKKKRYRAHTVITCRYSLLACTLTNTRMHTHTHTLFMYTHI